MIIKVIVDRIENENAILVNDEAGMEISVPLSSVDGVCDKGQAFSVLIGENGKEVIE